MKGFYYLILIYFESDVCDDIELMEKNQHKIDC